MVDFLRQFLPMMLHCLRYGLIVQGRVIRLYGTDSLGIGKKNVDRHGMVSF